MYGGTPMNPNPRLLAALPCALLLVIAASKDGAIAQEPAMRTVEQTVSLHCDPTLPEECASERLRAGRKLFDVETFGGNGRTCRTCHSKQTGTFSPEEALARLAQDPN